MSAFSRGCFPRQQIPFKTPRTLNIFFTSGVSPKTRFFSSTFFRYGPPGAIKGKKPKPSAVNISRLKPLFPKQSLESSGTARHVYQSYAATIAQKSHPVLLYHAPSHILFSISCYGMASFCFVYASWNFNAHYLNADPGLATWIPVAFGGICFLMAALGGWLVLGPAKIVKSITAIPQKALTPKGQPSLKLEIELRKMFPLPFFPARKLTVLPEEVQIPKFISSAETKLSAAELHAARKAEEKRIKELKEYEDTHIMTRPFRHMKWGAFELFRALRQSWTREGFSSLGVKGQHYKFDVSGGWVLDGGRALERLVTVNKSLSS